MVGIMPTGWEGTVRCCTRRMGGVGWALYRYVLGVLHVACCAHCMHTMLDTVGMSVMLHPCSWCIDVVRIVPMGNTVGGIASARWEGTPRAWGHVEVGAVSVVHCWLCS